MQFSQSFLDGIIKFLYSLERYFHVVLKTDLNISFSTTQSVLECEVISRYLYRDFTVLDQTHYDRGRCRHRHRPRRLERVRATWQKASKSLRLGDFPLHGHVV